MRGRGRAGVWQGRTAQNSGRIFALDGAWGAKVGLDPPKTDAIFIPGKKIQTTSRTVIVLIFLRLGALLGGLGNAP